MVERFYAELAAGMTVGQALEESRAGLHADRSRWLHPGPDAETIDLQDWFIPQLYQVGPDPALITDDRPECDPSRPRGARRIRKRMRGGFPPRPMYQFHGRALELLKLERFFREHSAVVISGMGGMGKTALAREAAAWWLRTGRFETAVFVSFEQKAGAERVGSQMPEVQMPEVRGQRSEGGSRRSEVGGRRSEVGGPNARGR